MIYPEVIAVAASDFNNLATNDADVDMVGRRRDDAWADVCCWLINGIGKAEL